MLVVALKLGPVVSDYFILTNIVNIMTHNCMTFRLDFLSRVMVDAGNKENGEDQSRINEKSKRRCGNIGSSRDPSTSPLDW